MVAIPENIITQALNVPHETRLAQAIVGALDLSEDEAVPWAVDNPDPATSPTELAGGAISDISVTKTFLALQYWPESLNDSRTVEWNPRNIPGGSHPIYQWTHGGERRLTFTAVFTTDTAPPDELAGGQDPYDTNRLIDGSPSSLLGGIQRGTRDLDIPAAISWLRYYTYPKYGRGADLRAFEPPKVILVFPNTRLGYDGSDYVVCVMTQCDVTYEAWFPNGVPRIVEVSLEFAEVVQYGGRIRFHDRSEMKRSSNLGSYLKPRGRMGGFR